ncbi:MAG: 50S ribosomal protein L24 [Bacteroidota bacterium]
MRKKHPVSPKLHIRKNDQVRVIAGNDRNQQGQVLRVLPKAYTAIVKGVRIVTRHRKPSSKNPKGGIEKREAPIHISNLMLIDPATGLPTRVGKKPNEQGKLQRYAKKTGAFIKHD